MEDREAEKWLIIKTVVEWQNRDYSVWATIEVNGDGDGVIHFYRYYAGGRDREDHPVSWLDRRYLDVIEELLRVYNLARSY